MKLEIHPILNGYIVIRQTEPQVGEIVLQIGDAEHFSDEVRKAAFNYRKTDRNNVERSTSPTTSARRFKPDGFADGPSQLSSKQRTMAFTAKAPGHQDGAAA